MRVDGTSYVKILGDHELKYHKVNIKFPNTDQCLVILIFILLILKKTENTYDTTSDGLWDVVDNDKALKYSHHFGAEGAAPPNTICVKKP